MHLRSINRKVVIGLFSLLGLFVSRDMYAQYLSAQDSAVIHRCMNMPDSRAKADSLMKTITRYRWKADVDTLITEALRVAAKTHYKEMEPRLLDFRGVYLRDHSRYSEAIDFHNKALEIAQEQQDEKSQIVIFNNLGVVYRRLDECSLALKYHFEALKLAEKAGDSYSESIALNSIGNVHILLENYSEAIRYFKRCLPIAEQANNKLGIAMNLNNIGEAYEQMNELDSAMYYYQASLRYNQQIKVRKGEAICCNSMGNVLKKQGQLKDAIALFTKALKIHKEVNDGIYIAGSYINLGLAYLEEKRFAEAGKNLQEGLKIALGVGSKSEVRDAYQGLTHLNEQKKDFEKACQFGRLYKSYADSIVNERNSRTMMQMEAIYSTEKKELKITALEKQKRLIFGMVAVGGVLLLSLLAFFIAQQQLAVSRRKLAEHHVKQLEQEKQLVATQAVLDGETAERVRLARDLHDGLGGMLSIIKLNLCDMNKGGILESEDVKRFEYALNTLDESIRELRRVAHNMMPDSLTRYGLKVSLADFSSNIPGAEFHYFGNEERLDPKLEVMIYRTTLELVNNVLKHANAEHIIIQIIQEPDRIALTLQDDGCGFDTTAPTKGSGLNNIRHRVASYNGRFEVWSELGKGTEVSVEVKTASPNPSKGGV